MAGVEEITGCIPRLRRYARALTGDRALADDLVQDTLERAWGRLHMWRKGSDLRAWLFSIMHNLYVNQTIARHAQASVALDEVLDLPVPATQEERLVIRELVAALGRPQLSRGKWCCWSDWNRSLTKRWRKCWVYPLGQ